MARTKRMLMVALCGAFACGGDDPPAWLGPDAAVPLDASAPLDAAGEPTGRVGDAGVPKVDSTLADASAPAKTPTLLPWAEGNSWTYRVTGDGEQSTKVTTVGALEPIGVGPNAQKLAHKVITRKGAMDETISWQAVEGERVLRYREQSFSKATGALQLDEHWQPGKLRVDWSAAHTAAGASWVETYSETKLPVDDVASTATATDTWMVDAVNQPVTVPAGTFTAIVLIKAGEASLKTYWFVPGVGKVKETGGQTEELVSYQVAP